MSKKNIKIFCGIAILCFISLELFGVDMLDSLSYSVSIASIIDWLYDRILWRFNPLEKTPRLYGAYNASVLSSYEGGTEYTSTIVITQTLSSISIVETLPNGACAESVTASLSRMTQEGPWFLYYTYLTHPKLSIDDDIHYGTTILYVCSNNILEGGYFTNRNKQTAGNLSLQKIKK